MRNDRDLGPHERRVRHLAEEGFCNRADQLDVVLRDKALEHDFRGDDVLLDDIPAKVLDEVDDDVVLVDPALVGDRYERHGFTPMRANFACNQRIDILGKRVLACNKRELLFGKLLAPQPEPFRRNAPERVDQVPEEGLARVGNHHLLDLPGIHLHIIEHHGKTVRLLHVLLAKRLPEDLQHRGKVGLVRDDERDLAFERVHVGKIADADDRRDLPERAHRDKDRHLRVDEDMEFLDHFQEVVVEQDVVCYLPVVLRPQRFGAFHFKVLKGDHLIVLYES